MINAMKNTLALLTLIALPALALAEKSYNVKLADAPTTATNTTATATLPAVNVTDATQFALCLTASMGTTLSGTNPAWLPGAVTCTASNSLDTITWFADAARSFAFNVTTNGTYLLQTNFASMGAVGYEAYTVTVSNNVNLTWTSAVKPGL